MTETCKLCSLYTDRLCFTRIYDENNTTITVQSFNSAGSRSPRLMCVLKRHTNTPTEEEKQAVEGTLRTIADRLSLQLKLNYQFEEVNELVEHYHRHVRF